MKPRKVKRHVRYCTAKYNEKLHRRYLVHAAGCVSALCRHSKIYFNPGTRPLIAHGTRIPRSLRKHFGFAVAP